MSLADKERIGLVGTKVGIRSKVLNLTHVELSPPHTPHISETRRRLVISRYLMKQSTPLGKPRRALGLSILSIVSLVSLLSIVSIVSIVPIVSSVHSVSIVSIVSKVSIVSIVFIVSIVSIVSI